MATVMLTFCFWGCGNSGVKKAPDGHTAQISLDWHGTYSGNLPCADCERIETELTINDDLTYILTSSHIKGDNEYTDTLSGRFTWKGNNIRLEGIPKNERSPWFKVEEGQVRYLDMQGKEIKGELENYYILRKNGNTSVEDKRWQIVEIYGKPVEGSPETHYMIFYSEDGFVSAKMNCNMLRIPYKIQNEFRVRFGHGMSTLMACPDDLEQEFLQVLSEADNLSTDGKYLSLNKARMAPLARFVVADL
ncbi:MAG TPA: copper resistance protein NlpE N-terminal domain-containing protein [Bacteroidales bacterium]|nr:copper resistance protein NlpE N-terminal domain-containing protein [Bacteroidales bacterium]HQJ82302.1 copper resistance protein NlpE N-terminal domain-containing protein [Bacteroidales bacterium]